MRRYLIAGGSVVAAAVACSCAVLLAGGGHGTYVPLSLVASPTLVVATLPKIGEGLFWTGIAVAPAFWGLIAWIVAGRPSPSVRYSVFVLLALHYAGAARLYLSADERPERFGEMLRAAPSWVLVVIGLYIAGQVVIWHRIVSYGRHDASTRRAHL